MQNEQKILDRAIQKALKAGATQAEAFLESGSESSVRVREGEVEDVTQATSRGLGLRVLVGTKLGFAYTSDFSPIAVDALADKAIALAHVSSADPAHRLPTGKFLEGRHEVAGLYDPKIEEIGTDWMIARSLEMERAARIDGRIKTFESSGAGTAVGEVRIASNEGLQDSYRSSSVYLYSVPVASDGAQLQMGYWMDVRRGMSGLESAEAVGRRAGERAARMLGAKKPKSGKFAVVFDPLMAASFVGGLARAVNGDLVRKRSSFLAGKLDKRIAPPDFTLVDDGTIPGAPGSAPFDGEGVPHRRTPVVENGVLRAFLYDTATARRAKAATTGNARRGYASTPHVGPSNFMLAPRDRSPESILSEVKEGIYVTAMLGSGLNVATGDFSRGVNGLWIRGGELAEPVQEATIAGNMLELLSAIDAIGSDLLVRGAVAAPTLRLAEVTVSGA